jgi:uncharacterized protein YjbJ (UPF0337 family)
MHRTTSTARKRSIQKRFLGKEVAMNWDQVEGKWDNFKGKVREKWGKLTDDDLDVIAGKRDQLLGRLKERYGMEKEAAEKELNQWLNRLH